MTDITALHGQYQIPPEAVEAARVAWLESASDYTRLDESIRAALRAGIAAWPGKRERYNYVRHGDEIVLPLPKEDAR